VRTVFFLLLAFSHSLNAAPAVTPGSIWVVEINGAIGPATSDYVLRTFDEARQSAASLIIITMNTPGGLDTSMRDIIEGILDSNIPVASYVSPKGARAASAGTYISYASHIAAMAPATNLGAATPVQIGTPSLPKPPGQETAEKPEPGATAMEKKIINDASAYIRGLAELRERNVEWAEEAVREASSLSASEALELNVIDLIADDLDHLIELLDGKTITIDGNELTMALAGKEVHKKAPDWRTELLIVLTNPNLVLVLGMIGIYGIILEFYNPGATVPGVVGVICLVLAGYSLQLLPVNYAGLALLLLGIILMAAEAMVPSFGIMGIGGIVAFSIGGLMLFDSELEAFQVGLPTLGATAIVSALFIFATVNIALKMRNRAVTTGLDTIVGQTGQVLTNQDSKTQIRVGAEIWTVQSDDDLKQGDTVTVVAVDGLELQVSKSSQNQATTG
jgi:membrane-bound serine protease (ClpP class)|tara:strand:- start:711 stop:2057 length:1347 start_codon:yes stop_codon:yes gene_type:complete